MGVRYMGVGWPAMNLWLGGNNPTNITTLYIYPQTSTSNAKGWRIWEREPKQKGGDFQGVDASHLPLESCCESYQLVGIIFSDLDTVRGIRPDLGQGSPFLDWSNFIAGTIPY